MNKILIISSLFFLIIFNSFIIDNEHCVEANLVNVEYFSKCNCTGISPVLVRVTYSVSGNLANLKMKHVFSDGISITNSIKETDKQGRVLYNFCISENEVKEFVTIFIDSNGKQSTPIKVKVHAKDITLGTAPTVMKIK